MNFLKRSLLILMGIAFLFCLFDVQYTSDTAAEDIIRLHIIANSNSNEDQSLKLKVRDEILKEYSAILSSAQSKSDAESIINQNLDNIEKTALSVTGECMNIRVEYTNTYIPERTYGNKTYPAGNYDALRIVIGEGEGENWWCVMFPPLCLDEADNEADNTNIFQEKTKIKIRFRIVDFFKQIFKL